MAVDHFATLCSATSRPISLIKSVFVQRGSPLNAVSAESLLNIFVNNGLNVVANKPFQTGYARMTGSLPNVWQIFGKRDSTIDKLSEMEFIRNTVNGDERYSNKMRN